MEARCKLTGLTLVLVHVLLVGRLVRGGLNVRVLDGINLLLHGDVHRRLVFAHVHVAAVALASKGHVARGERRDERTDPGQTASCDRQATLVVSSSSPFRLAQWGTCSGDEAVPILALLRIVLQQGVLVSMEVVHQIAIAAVFCHQVQRP